ncbi:PAS domain S-box protein [Sedimenticola hydrogenitrophicus]|uniref:PAS domain-containing protein n=1 Tax=Sedimenticola hydrogenitrophicus TaxID=2967975 RepID=UPI0021A83C4D|nr:PAS domain S-box protein [Sedimenticola hydrogenitrophicus]
MSSLKWMVLIGGVVAILTVLVVSVYLHHVLEREAVQNWREQSLPLAATLAGRVEQQIDSAASALRLVAGLPQFRQLLDPGGIQRAIGGVAESAEPEKRRILQRLLKENADFSVLFMLASNGDHYLAEPFEVQRGITKFNMRDRDYFQETQRRGETVLSSSFVGADGKLAVAINTPIRDAQAGIAAHLGGVFHLDHLSRLIRSIDSDAFDELFLLDRNGSLVGHDSQQWLEPDRRELFLQRPEIGRLLKAARAEGAGAIGYQELKDPDLGRVLHAFTVPLASGWRMVALRDRESLLREVQPRSNVITATTALILLGIAGFGLVFANSVGRRWELAATALRLSKSELEEEVAARTYELVASHEHIELLLASTGAGIFGIDLQGRCTFCNMACVETLNYRSEQDLLGKPLNDIVHHCQCDGTPYGADGSPILSAIHSDKRVHREHEVFCTFEGECLPVEYRAYPMRRQGEVVGAVVTFNDISTRINAQEAQADSDARFHSLFAQSNDAIFLMNPETGHYLDANRAAERLTGRRVEELLTLTTADVCPAGADQRRSEAMTLHETRDMGEVVYVRPDGIERTARLSVVPTSGGLVFGIAHDITDQRASSGR